MIADYQNFCRRSSDPSLLPYADRFFPAWLDRENRLRAMTVKVDSIEEELLTANFHWFKQEQKDPTVPNPVLIKTFQTVHAYPGMEDTMGDYFKPALGEVFSQLPEDVKNREGRFYFTTYMSGRPDYDNASVTAVTRVYQVASQTLHCSLCNHPLS